MNACMHANEYIHTTRYLECLDTLARHTTPNGECANNEFKTSRCGIDPSSNTSINPERCVPSFPKKEKGKKKKNTLESNLVTHQQDPILHGLFKMYEHLCQMLAPVSNTHTHHHHHLSHLFHQYGVGLFIFRFAKLFLWSQIFILSNF